MPVMSRNATVQAKMSVEDWLEMIDTREKVGGSEPATIDGEVLEREEPDT